jgi:hypothetical protein
MADIRARSQGFISHRFASANAAIADSSALVAHLTSLFTTIHIRDHLLARNNYA